VARGAFGESTDGEKVERRGGGLLLVGEGSNGLSLVGGLKGFDEDVAVSTTEPEG